MYIIVHFCTASPYCSALGILRSSSSTTWVRRSGRPWYMCFSWSSSSHMLWLIRKPSSAWSLSIMSEIRLDAAVSPHVDHLGCRLFSCCQKQRIFSLTPCQSDWRSVHMLRNVVQPSLPVRKLVLMHVAILSRMLTVFCPLKLVLLKPSEAKLLVASSLSPYEGVKSPLWPCIVRIPSKDQQSLYCKAFYRHTSFIYGKRP